jgi:hypothetical protein
MQVSPCVSPPTSARACPGLFLGRHFACTRALRARTCTRSDLVSSTFPAMPEKVEEGVWLHVVTPATDEVRASRLRRFARHFRNQACASAGADRVRSDCGSIGVSAYPLPGWGEGGVRGEPVTWVAFENAEQRRTSRASRASTVRSMWRAAGAIVRVSTPAGLSEQRKAARRAVFVGAPLAPAASLHLRFAQVSLRSRASAVFAYFLCQDKESKRPRGREAGRQASAAGKSKRTTS